MKKVTMLLLVLFVSAFMTGCKDEKDKKTPEVKNSIMNVAIEELRAHLEKDEYSGFYGAVSGSAEVRELRVNVENDEWRFLFEVNKSSVTFVRTRETKIYNSVKDLIVKLDEIRNLGDAKLTVDGKAIYKDNKTIIVNFQELDNEVEIELDNSLLDQQQVVTFVYQGKEYTVELTTAFIDIAKYESLSTDAIRGNLQSLNSAVSLDGITQDINLPSEIVIGNKRYSIEWETNKEAVISTSGTVNRPSRSEGDITVKLTATLVYQGPAAAVVGVNKFDIEVVVKAMPEVRMGYYLDIEVQNPRHELSLDGSTVMEVVARLRGEEAKDFQGNMKFTSNYGLRSAQAEAVIDNGVARFNVTLPNEIRDINDMISVEVVSQRTQNPNLVGLKSEDLSVRYIASNIEGGVTEDNTYIYPLGEVRSANVADRVFIYVAGVRPGHLDRVKESILSQVRLYNNVDGNNPIELVDIVREQVLNVDGNGNTSYAFEVLTKLPEYSAIGVNYEDTSRILKDNQKNYWEVEESAEDIRLLESNISQDRYFNLIDRNAPRVSRVLSFNDDTAFLPSDSIVVIFDKAINRKTAENPANYTLNGTTLTDEYVRYIRVMDVRDQENLMGQSLLDYTGIDEDKAREYVVIQLTRSFARNSMIGLKSGSNLLQVQNISDWAGMTDLTDNNKISTQNMRFDHNPPVGETVAKIWSESPEQFVIKYEGVYGGQEDVYEWTVDKSDLIVTLNGQEITDYVITHSSQFKTFEETDEFGDVIFSNKDAYSQYGDNYYLVELTEDWTELGFTYHGLNFRVEVREDKFDAFGNTVRKQDLALQTRLTRDIVSPSFQMNRVLDSKENKTTTGRYWFRMSEPVQLHSNDNNISVYPAVTPNTTQATGAGVPVPEFRYIKVGTTKDKDGNIIIEDGYEVSGILEWVEDLHDMEFKVRPSQDLELGQWMLTVDNVSDDHGNNSDTITRYFEVVSDFDIPVVPVETPDNVIEPKILWTFALNNHIKPNTADEHDWVYILYSRAMDIEAIEAATYDINGKPLEQGVGITRAFKSDIYLKNNDVTNVYYGQNDKPMYAGYLVEITLPKDFLYGDDIVNQPGDEFYRRNMLTVPRSLRAIDDKVEETSEVLLFDNNRGSNQFELEFIGVDNLDGFIQGPAYEILNDLKLDLGL